MVARQASVCKETLVLCKTGVLCDFCGFAEGIQLAVGMHAFLSKATVFL